MSVKRCKACTAEHRFVVLWSIGSCVIIAIASALGRYAIAFGMLLFERCGEIVFGLLEWNDRSEIEDDDQCTCEDGE